VGGGERKRINDIGLQEVRCRWFGRSRGRSKKPMCQVKGGGRGKRLEENGKTGEILAKGGRDDSAALSRGKPV